MNIELHINFKWLNMQLLEETQISMFHMLKKATNSSRRVEGKFNSQSCKLGPNMIQS